MTAPGASGAGTVHLGVGHDGLVDVAADLSVGRMPRDPFVLLGQMTTSDPTRSPAGTESAWAYTHLPRALAHDEAAVAARLQGSEFHGDRLFHKPPSGARGALAEVRVTQPKASR